MFKSNGSGAFSVSLPNDYDVSVAFGEGNYCSNRNARAEGCSRQQRHCHNAEMAVFKTGTNDTVNLVTFRLRTVSFRTARPAWCLRWRPHGARGGGGADAPVAARLLGPAQHVAVAWSGGKDSTATLTLLIHLIDAGELPQPEALYVFYADTRQELPPLQAAAERSWPSCGSATGSR
jgi:hypothetical protein